VQQLLKTALDFILPNQCIICQNINQNNLCGICVSKISIKSNLWLKENSNTIFQTKSNDQIQILDKNSYIKSILSCSSFQDTIIKKSIHYLKYKNLPQLANPLGAIMLRAFGQHLKFKDNILICPIPLHYSRLRFRGYNQAELLAQYLHKKLNLPLYSDLKRNRNTPQQMRIQNRQARIKNMDNAFEALKDNSENQFILIIDDVTTTLSTIQQAAKALYKQGFTDIYALILAH
jgi:ComF family protein